jgi:hypothetical protein
MNASSPGDLPLITILTLPNSLPCRRILGYSPSGTLRLFAVFFLFPFVFRVFIFVCLMPTLVCFWNAVLLARDFVTAVGGYIQPRANIVNLVSTIARPAKSA